jgi:hypothetical protein
MKFGKSTDWDSGSTALTAAACFELAQPNKKQAAIAIPAAINQH